MPRAIFARVRIIEEFRQPLALGFGTNDAPEQAERTIAVLGDVLGTVTTR
jgi:hypothetical protein